MSSPIPRVLAYLLLALTALVIAHRGVLVRRAPDTRLIVYSLDQPVEMALSAGDTAVRIVTWLEGPEPDVLDAYRTWPYAVRARVVEEEAGPQIDQTAWLSARVGFVPDEDTLVPTARAKHGRMFTDDRLIVLPFAAPLSRAAQLRVEAASVPPGLRIGFAAFRATERTPLVQERLRLGQHRDAPRLLAPLAPFGFADLGETRSSRLVQRSWQRLGAITRLGRAPEKLELYTAFDDNSLDDSMARAWPMRPGQIASVSVQGPTTVTARWLHPRGAGPAAVDTWIRRLGPGGHVERLERLGLVTEVGPLVVDDVGTVEIGVDPSQSRPALLVFTTRGGALLGDPPTRLGPDGARISAPDAVRTEAWRVGPGSPARFPVSPGDRLRITARRPLPAAAPQAFAPPAVAADAALVVEVTDAMGAVIATFTPPLAVVPSPYDRYSQADNPLVHALSEPVTFVIDAPPDATELRISTRGGDADLRVARFDPDAPPYEVQRPWADLPLPLGPLPPRFTAWASVAPLAVDGLLRDGRMVGWLVQIRPRIEDPRPARVAVPEGAAAPAWIAQLAPTSRPEPTRLGVRSPRAARPDDPAVDAAVARPPRPDAPPTPPVATVPRGPRRLLELDRPFDLVVRDEAGDGRAVGRAAVEIVVPESGALDVDHRLPVDQVGQRVTITLGERVETRVAHAAAGRWRFEDLPTGPLRLQIDADGTFVARGQPLGDRLVQRVWRLVAGEHATIALPPSRAVQVVTWTPAGAAGQLGWRLVGGVDPPRGAVAFAPGRGRAAPLSWDGAALTDLPDVRVASAGATHLELDVGSEADVFVRVLVADEATP